MSGRILVADDQLDVLEALRLLLKTEGFQVTLTTSPEQVRGEVQEREFDLLLMDLNYTRDTTSGREGLDLLRDLRERDASLPIVVMTAWGSVEVAVEAMQQGARDFVEKPWDNNRLLTILRTQVELGRALRRQQRLEQENQVLRGERTGQQEMIAESRAMQPVLQVIERVAPSDANILITGENGTGKSLVARVIHQRSERAPQPLVSVNAGALSEGVFESELFGHVRGAFTDAKSDRVGRFEMADGGTLFLDEIANVPSSQQTKLLRVLETGELERVGSSKTRTVDVRVLSATNADLAEEVGEGRFRQDLLYRLNTITLHMPPLRDRREDIPLLAQDFLQRHAQRYRKNLSGFEQSAHQGLLNYPWPGNVRELDHAVERGVLMATGDVVRLPDLGLQDVAGDSLPPLEEMTLDDIEKLVIQKALTRHEGNVKQAARALGLSRSALYRRLERYEL